MATEVRTSRSVKINGPALKRLRQGKGWSVEDLATESKISDRTIRTAESSGSVHVRTLRAFADVFDVECEDLLGGDSNLAISALGRAGGHFSQFLRLFRKIIERKSDLDKALLSFNLAANHTLAYCARVSSGIERNLDEELQLSNLWLLVAASLGPFNLMMFEQNILNKAQYWAHIDCWSDHDIRDAGIELEPLMKMAKSVFDELKKEA